LVVLTRSTNGDRRQKKIFSPVLPIAKIAPPAANFLMDGLLFRHGGFAVANWPRPSRNFPVSLFGTAARSVFASLVLRQPS
jgi:hypothetical protein